MPWKKEREKANNMFLLNIVLQCPFLIGSSLYSKAFITCHRNVHLNLHYFSIKHMLKTQQINHYFPKQCLLFCVHVFA